jgi:pimeloyl-ACP methyl ester carboxylesterase
MRTTRAGEFEVEYTEAGAGPAIILLHSSASGLRQWRRLMDDLKGRYRLLAVNLFGYGTTSVWPGRRTQTLADQAGLAVAVADRVDEPVILIGHSLGGAVALETALQLGSRLRAVAVFEPILFSLLATHGPADAFVEIHDLSVRYQALGMAAQWDKAGKAFIDYWAGPGSWSAMPDERKAGLRITLPNVQHEWDAVIAPFRPLSDWGAIAAPVHVLRAADTRRPTHAVASLLAATHKDWRLHELKEGGHMAPVARPDLTNPLFARILADVVP